TVDPGTGAAQAGLRPGDAILVIACRATAEVDGVQKWRRRIGESVPMLVQRGEQMVTVAYRPPELKIDTPYLILSFIGFLYLAIGLFTLFRGGTNHSRLFYF